MNYPLPRQRPAVLVIQCLLVLFAGMGLYLFLQARQETAALQAAISRLRQQDSRLRHAKTVIDQYGNFIDRHPFYRQRSTTLKWTRVAESWDDPPYEVLLDRLARLYRPESPFVLERFSATLADQREEAEGAPGPGGEEGGGGQAHDAGSETFHRVFRLQGYVLCPCR